MQLMMQDEKWTEKIELLGQDDAKSIANLLFENMILQDKLGTIFMKVSFTRDWSPSYNGDRIFKKWLVVESYRILI